MDNVMDLAEERPMNLIHGQHMFRVAGFNMVLSDEGATAYLENDKGVTFPLVIDEVVSKQLFKAHTSELLPGGDYKLVVKSRAAFGGEPQLFSEVRFTEPPPSWTELVTNLDPVHDSYAIAVWGALRDYDWPDLVR